MAACDPLACSVKLLRDLCLWENDFEETVMPGVPDHAKRQRVRRFLRVKSNQELPDREVARQVGVSRQLVTEIRRQLIALGLHPPRSHRHSCGLEGYQPGAKARGGYVYDEYGRVIPEVEWLLRQLGRTTVDRPGSSPGTRPNRSRKQP